MNFNAIPEIVIDDFDSLRLSDESLEILPEEMPAASQEEAPQEEALQAEASQEEAFGADAPQEEAFEADAPQLEAFEADVPQEEAFQADAPLAEASQAEAFEADAPQAEAFQADAPQAEASQAEAFQAEAHQAEAFEAEASSVEFDSSPSTEEMVNLKNIINLIVPCLSSEDDSSDDDDAATKSQLPVVVKGWEKNKPAQIRINYSSKEFARIYLLHQLKLHCEQNRCLNKYLYTEASKESLGLSVLPLIKPRACVHFIPTEEQIYRFLYGSGRLPMQPQVDTAIAKPTKPIKPPRAKGNIQKF